MEGGGIEGIEIAMDKLGKVKVINVERIKWVWGCVRVGVSNDGITQGSLFF